MEIIAAVVLTDRQELWFAHPSLCSNTSAIADLLFECERLNIEVDRVLEGAGRAKDLLATKLLIYGVVVRLLSHLDGLIQASTRGIVDLHKRDVTHADDYYLRAALRYASFDYFLGMIYGFFVCLFLIVVGALIWIGFWLDVNFGKELIGCLIAGGVGAVVSVMSRMTFGELSLDYQAGRKLLTLFGAFRPRDDAWGCDVGTGIQWGSWDRSEFW
jgi:hypothetical protein